MILLTVNWKKYSCTKIKKVSAKREAYENIESEFDENDLYNMDNMILEDTTEKLEWLKHAFEYKQKSTYGVENQDDMTHIHDKYVNYIAECNLLHGIINPTKLKKVLNFHYSPILHECMNTRKGKEKFKNFWILSEIGCSSTIVMVIIVVKLHTEKDDMMQCHTQDGNITTNIEVKVDFILPKHIATDIVTWNYHVDESTKGRYDIILGIYLST